MSDGTSGGVGVEDIIMSSLFVMQVMAMMLVLGWSFMSSLSPLSCEHGEYKIPPARFGLAALASSRRFWVKTGRCDAGAIHVRVRLYESKLKVTKPWSDDSLLH